MHLAPCREEEPHIHHAGCFCPQPGLFDPLLVLTFQKIMKRLIKRYVLKAQVDRENDEVNEGKRMDWCPTGRQWNMLSPSQNQGVICRAVFLPGGPGEALSPCRLGYGQKEVPCSYRAEASAPWLAVGWGHPLPEHSTSSQNQLPGTEPFSSCRIASTSVVMSL